MATRTPPRAMLALAAVLALALLVLHVAGLRTHTGIWSGSPLYDPVLGVLYTLAWFAALVGSPALALGAGIYLVLDRVLPGAAPATGRTRR